MEIEDPSGLNVFETEPNNGINSGALQLVAGTTYSIRLRSKNDDPAQYVVTLALQTTPGDNNPGDDDGTDDQGSGDANTVSESEVNDTHAQATPFALGGDRAVQLVGTSQDKDDEDFFTFTPTSSGGLSVHVLTTNDNVPALEVEDVTGQEVFETEPNNGVNTGTFQLSAGTTYFLRLRSKTDDAAAYVVELNLHREGDLTFDGLVNRADIASLIRGRRPSGDDLGTDADLDRDGRISIGDFIRLRDMMDEADTEPGDLIVETENNDRKDRANRFHFGSNGVAQFQGTSRDHDDKDFFVFTATESGQLNVEVGSPNGNFAALEIEDSHGVLSAETQPNDGVNSAAADVSVGETYFVRLRSKSDDPAEYIVDLQLTVAVDGGSVGTQPTGDDDGTPDQGPGDALVSGTMDVGSVRSRSRSHADRE